MKTLSRLFCALAFAVAVASPALADDVKARAEQNPDTLVVNTDPGATVSASVPSTAGSGASATTTRTRIDLSIDGDGATATTAFGAQGFNRSDYVLIWLDDGSVLTAGEADAFDLAFNFRAAGFMDVRAVSLSRASVLVDVQVIATTGERFRTGVVEVFGPTGDLVIGDAAYVGAFDQRFSLVHASDATGVLAMEAQGSAANAADTAYFLALDSIALARGAAPSRGLGIRFAETGEVIRVIPEASTWAAMLAGLLVAAVLGRRRAA